MSAYEIIDAEKAHFPIGLLCEAVGRSRSAYDRHRRGERSKRARTDAALSPQMHAIHDASRARYGSPKVHAALAAQGTCTGKSAWRG